MQPRKTDTPDRERIQNIIGRALEEDIRSGDVTTEAVVAQNDRSKAVWKAKAPGIIAGLNVAREVFLALDPELEWNPVVHEGNRAEPGDIVVEMNGRTRALLTAERTALNLVQRMSGIATETSRYVALLDGLKTKILDTRKTVPGLRILDKYAVTAGGGENHRMGLFDMAMIKDNHIAAAGGIIPAVRRVRETCPGVEVEVETTDTGQVEEALAAGADIIMLDNMTLPVMKEAVEMIGVDARTEASGNITLENVREVAETGVDFISVGSLTHSVTAFDISQYIISE